MDEDLDSLLPQWREGDVDAGDRALKAAYAELRRLAASYFRHETPGHTLQPTALVHEAYLKIAHGTLIEWKDRAHFFALAARQMRRILVDHARRRRALKRHDTCIGVSLAARPHAEDILTVDRILADLEKLDERAAHVTELRVFGGLSDAEIASTLGISVSTVKRNWTFARAWLLSRLRGPTLKPSDSAKFEICSTPQWSRARSLVMSFCRWPVRGTRTSWWKLGGCLRLRANRLGGSTRVCWGRVRHGWRAGASVRTEFSGSWVKVEWVRSIWPLPAITPRAHRSP